MSLPIQPPFRPMEAKAAGEMPVGAGVGIRAVKWDGFRCLAFRDGADVELYSKAGQPLSRYFPEVAKALRAVRATGFVLDGELVLPGNGRLSFDDPLQHIHPAASRVEMLARTNPVRLFVFDPCGK
jgi:ATP-dependent DNA ligase